MKHVPAKLGVLLLGVVAMPVLASPALRQLKIGSEIVLSERDNFNFTNPITYQSGVRPMGNLEADRPHCNLLLLWSPVAGSPLKYEVTEVQGGGWASASSLTSNKFLTRTVLTLTPVGPNVPLAEITCSRLSESTFEETTVSDFKSIFGDSVKLLALEVDSVPATSKPALNPLKLLKNARMRVKSLVMLKAESPLYFQSGERLGGLETVNLEKPYCSITSRAKAPESLTLPIGTKLQFDSVSWSYVKGRSGLSHRGTLVADLTGAGSEIVFLCSGEGFEMPTRAQVDSAMGSTLDWNL